MSMDMVPFQSQSASRVSSKVVVMAATAASAALLACKLLNGRKSRVTADRREIFLRVVGEISRRFFHVCRDLTSVAGRVRSQITQQGVRISEEKLCEQLTTQFEVMRKLEEIQREVTQEWGITIEEVEQIQFELVAVDDHVRTHAEGFKAMLDDALEGKWPVLPNVQLPAAVTEEAVLKIQYDIHALESKKLVEAIAAAKKDNGEGMPMTALGEAMQQASREAREEVLCEHAPVLLGECGTDGAAEIFWSAVGIYFRDASFRKEWGKLSAKQKSKLDNLLKLQRRLDADGWNQ